MPWSVGKGTPKNITVASIGVGGTPKGILNAWVGVGGVPKKFFSSSATFTASSAPLTQSASTTFNSPFWTGAIIDAFSASTAGETGTVTYQWNKISGSADITLSDDTTSSVNVNFVSTASSSGSAVLSCDVTDDTGTVTTNTVSVNFT